MLSNAVVVSVTIDSQNRVGKSKIYYVEGLEPGARLQQGYFAKVNDILLFANNDFVIRVDTEQYKARTLEGFQSFTSFQTAIAIEDTLLAVEFESEGIFLYKLIENGEKLELVETLGQSQISEQNRNLSLTDLVYYPAQKSLIILDSNTGITSFKIGIDTELKITLQKGNLSLHRELCDMMHLHDNNLYLVCSEVSRISLIGWPKIEERNLPNPNIKIREIYAHENFVAFSGRNIFRIMYLDRLVNYYQNEFMDKLVFDKNIFVSANEYGILIGTFNIVQPYISCTSENSSLLGSHPLVFKTVAECNETYLQSRNMKLDAQNEDSCIYTIYRDIYFWQPGTINTFPIVILLIFLGLVVLTVGLIWLFKRVSVKRARERLAEYTMTSSNQQNGGHKELIEEEVPESSNDGDSQRNNSRNSGNNNHNKNENENDKSLGNNLQDDEDPEKKESEIELKNYDIQ